jgi:hypothetical protein
LQSYKKLRQVRQNLGRVRGIVCTMQQHDSVQVEKEESRFTPYRISFADVRYHRDEMSLAAETKTMVLGISMNPLTSQHVSWIMLQWVYKSRLKKQTQKQFAHLHNQHRKKMNIANALQPSFLFSKPVDPKKLAAANITTCLHNTIPYHSCGRTGRGGHLIFDRWNPPTRTPLDSSSKLFSSFPIGPALDRWEASQLPSWLHVVDHCSVPDPPPQSPFSYLDVPIQTPIQQPFNFTDT